MTEARAGGGVEVGPHSPPVSISYADLPVRCSLSQHQRAHGHLVLEPLQPRAGGTHGHVEPFPVDLGGSHKL